MTKAAKVVENEIVKLDFGTFQKAEFRQCKLVFGGGRPPLMVNNRFFDRE